MPKKRQFDPDAVESLCRRYGGAVRVSALEWIGMKSQTIAYRCRPGGPWQRILPGVILAFSGTPSFLQKIMAALLYARAGAIVTGVANLRLRGFRDLPDDWTTHLLIPDRRKRASKSFVIVERTIRLPRHAWIRGVPCAPVARAVIDAARRINDFDTVRAIIGEAVQRRYCGIDQLIVELAEAQIRGTRLPRLAIREVMAGIRSVAEAKARKLIQRARLPQPKWNHDVYDSTGRWLCRPDAIWPELGVVLEIDSRAWHFSPFGWRKTQARQRRLTIFGLLVISISPADLLENPALILAEIRAALATAVSRPAPTITVKSPAAAA